MATAKKSAPRKRKLVIVESPSKAKTIGKFLGSSYKVIASVGHVRDLPKSKMGIDIENDFTPQYINIRGKGDIIKELKREAKKASRVYLATDPDREGEAISWHIAYLLGIDSSTPCRIEFHEITKNAVKEAIKNPRPIDLDLVDAQQARRVLDRLVGYNISPLLWRKIRRGLSAGRVQSAALKMICDREKEIRDFKPEESWDILAAFKKEKEFSAKLVSYKGKKVVPANKEEADAVLAKVEKDAFRIVHVEEKDRKRKPYAPFTTSTLQQDASNRLNFNTRKTMRIAQQLYEGVDLGGSRGSVGLVTYIRTDSVRISSEAKEAAERFIAENYGKEYCGKNFFSKKKDAQDAHEAIRPSMVDLVPADIKEALSSDQFKLYQLIWTRFMASQMKEAVYTMVSAEIENGDYLFRASGSKLKFDGFRKVYAPDKNEDHLLPPLAEQEALKAEKVWGEQKFTSPPPRFTEASLIKYLEEKEIGRPSTYAPIASTLLDRKYIQREKRTLLPTDLGFLVTGIIEQYFKEVADAGFTAQMERSLDEVAEHGTDWKEIIRNFYSGFEKELQVADEEIKRVEFEDEPTDEVCELCGRPMVIKQGRYGRFMACSGYPECKNTKPIVKTIGVKCPDCGRDIVEKRSRRGRVFYGCSGYPECKRAYWNKPVNKTCPKCGSLLVEKKTKTGDLACSNSECGYTEKKDREEST